jgi:hypothetical protein
MSTYVTGQAYDGVPAMRSMVAPNLASNLGLLVLTTPGVACRRAARMDSYPTASPSAATLSVAAGAELRSAGSSAQ